MRTPSTGPVLAQHQPSMEPSPVQPSPGRKRRRPLLGRGTTSHARNCEKTTGAFGTELPTALPLEWEQVSDPEAEGLLLKQLRSFLFAKLAVLQTAGKIADGGVSFTELLTEMKPQLGSFAADGDDFTPHDRFLCLLFLSIGSKVGHINSTYHPNQMCNKFTLNSNHSDISFADTLNNFVFFLKEVINSVRTSQGNMQHKEQVNIDITAFVETEREEIYFSALSRLLRTSGHKLKSKLKPENIGLLIPGEFLPTHKRILKSHVALQIAEKSNHLYTWKDAGDPLFVRRKKTSLANNLLSRRIRPRNRSDFVNQEIFYSAWDTHFYSAKCEEVLENEYYNQLENSLNNHSKRRQLSVKKIEINKRKKANDTKDSFYFDAFQMRKYSKVAATGQINKLRDAVIARHKANFTLNETQNAKQYSASKQCGSSSDRKSTSRKSSVARNGSSANKKSISNPMEILEGVNGYAGGDDEDRKPNIKKESRLGGCIKSEFKAKMEPLIPTMYFNPVLGLIKKPKAVLESGRNLESFVHTTPISLQRVKEQFFNPEELSHRNKRRRSAQNAISSANQSTEVIIPKFKKCSFNLDAELILYKSRKNYDVSLKECSVFSEEERHSMVRSVVLKMLYKVAMGLQFPEMESKDNHEAHSSSEELTSDEYFERLHEDFFEAPTKNC